MRTLRVALAVLPAILVCACSNGSAPSAEIDVIGAPMDPFDTGPRLSPAGQLVRAATAEGLVGLDEQGRVIPALADRWIVTDDGLSYIFRLRDGAWPGGAEISGETAKAALRSALAGLAGTSLGLDLSGVEEIRAMAGRVVEIRLSRPVPDLLQLLAQPELGLVYKGSGGGPMVLRRNGDAAALTPIPPGHLGLPQPAGWRERVRTVLVRAVPAHVATERFATGQVDVVLGGRFESLPLAQAVAGLSRRPLKLDPAPGLFGLAVATSRGWLAVAECREAMALTIDRDAVASALGLGGWGGRAAPVPLPLPATMPGGSWIDRPLAERRAEASARIARCKASHGDPGPLRLALPDGPGAEALHASLAQDFAAIGLALARVPARVPGDLRLLDAVARYPRPDWYLHQLSCATLRGPCSAEADARLAAAQAQTDPAKSAQLLSQAQGISAGAAVFIPLGAPVRWSLVRERVEGFSPNPAAFHPLPPLAGQAL